MPAAKTKPPQRQQARSVETRAAILSAAGRIFAEAGLAGARTEAIAEVAGVNKAMLYYYFKSKESLYKAVLEDHIMEFSRAALEVLTGTGSARAILLRYVGLHFDFVCGRMAYAPLFQQIMSGGENPMREIVQKYIRPRSEAVEQLLERGMRDGEFRKSSPLHTAVSIAALVVFYFSSAPVLQMLGHADAYSKANLKRRKKEVLDFIRHGLFADPDAPLP